jgi:hypothetical protein
MTMGCGHSAATIPRNGTDWSSMPATNDARRQRDGGDDGFQRRQPFGNWNDRLTDNNNRRNIGTQTQLLYH